MKHEIPAAATRQSPRSLAPIASSVASRLATASGRRSPSARAVDGTPDIVGGDVLADPSVRHRHSCAPIY